MEMTRREQKAVEFFTSGDNCAQAVFKAYADVAGLTEDQAAMVAVGFGGGIGRMRQNCGAFSAAVMLCGALEGPQGADADVRTDVYRRVQLTHARFLEKTGSISCAELLNRKAGTEGVAPDERTAEYYAKRPCVGIVRAACQVIDEQLAEKDGQR